MHEPDITLTDYDMTLKFALCRITGNKNPPAGKTCLPKANQRLVDLYTAWDKP